MPMWGQKFAAVLAVGLGLSACTTTDEIATTANYRGAGYAVGFDSFGIATQTNTLRMSDANFFSLELANRFATDVNTVVNFAYNSADLDQTAKATLRQQAAWIRQFPEVRFRVYGHADATGSSAYNKALGLKRAKTAVNYLIQNGISRNRLEAMTSMGDTQPLIVTQDRERLNSRTVTEVTGFVDSHPMVMDGKYGLIVYRQYTGSATTVQ